MLGVKCDIDFEEVFNAYLDCRKGKSRTQSCIFFENNLSSNLYELTHDLQTGKYSIGTSVCFVVTSPNTREIWAAGFRDRIVHHIVYNRIEKIFSRKFIADSCACIPGRGTLYGAKRLERHLRTATENWKKDQYYLKCDLSNFFVSINKDVLWGILEKSIPLGWISELTKYILYHDPREDVILNSSSKKFDLVEPRKQLMRCPQNKGLPIGNLTSQFFANVLLNELDHYVKHVLKCKFYVRYVDDMVLLHSDRKVLKQWEDKIQSFLSNIDMSLNPRKTIIQHVNRGVTFVGHRITKQGRNICKMSKKRAISRIRRYSDVEYIDAHIGYLSQMSATTEYVESLLMLQSAEGYFKNATSSAMQTYGFSVNRKLRTGQWAENTYINRHFKRMHQKIEHCQHTRQTLESLNWV